MMFSGCMMMSACLLDNNHEDEIPLSKEALEEEGVICTTAKDDVVVANLSHIIGRVIYDCMRKKHPRYRGMLWNVTMDSVVGPFHHTPVLAFTSTKNLKQSQQQLVSPENGEDSVTL
jgi:hypothetical protein